MDRHSRTSIASIDVEPIRFVELLRVPRDVDRAYPDVRELAQRVDVMRWGHAMVRPTPDAGHLAPCLNLIGVDPVGETLDGCGSDARPSAVTFLLIVST